MPFLSCIPTMTTFFPCDLIQNPDLSSLKMALKSTKLIVSSTPNAKAGAIHKYLVRWTGYGAKHNEWISGKYLTDNEALLRAFPATDYSRLFSDCLSDYIHPYHIGKSHHQCLSTTTMPGNRCKNTGAVQQLSLSMSLLQLLSLLLLHSSIKYHTIHPFYLARAGYKNSLLGILNV